MAALPYRVSQNSTTLTLTGHRPDSLLRRRRRRGFPGDHGGAGPRAGPRGRSGGRGRGRAAGGRHPEVRPPRTRPVRLTGCVAPRAPVSERANVVAHDRRAPCGRQEPTAGGRAGGRPSLGTGGRESVRVRDRVLGEREGAAAAVRDDQSASRAAGTTWVATAIVAGEEDVTSAGNPRARRRAAVAGG